MEWISVKESLPEKRKIIQVYGKTAYLNIEYQTSGYFDNGWFDWSGDDMENTVTHWMPLPQPPK